MKVTEQQLIWYDATEIMAPIGKEILVLLPKTFLDGRKKIVLMQVTARRDDDRELLDHEGETTGWDHDSIMWWAHMPPFLDHPGWIGK